MTIVLCGGGSGGHITPLVAVARELRRLNPKVRIIFIGDRGGRFADIITSSGLFDEEHTVFTGKLRRYHGESWFRRLTDIRTIFFNIRDVFRLSIGLIQAVFLLKRLKADAVLFKGGSVCVPISMGARLVRPKIVVTHDSDAIPGLANRIAGKIANYHATGMPPENYPYPKEKIRYVGLPIDARFRQYSQDEQRFLKEKFGINPASRVVLLTGGSQGARRLNHWVIQELPEIFSQYSKLHVVLVLGKGNISQADIAVLKPFSVQMTLLDFTDELFHYSAIADVIISRAGATTMTEFAQQKKACILVPNPDLTGGHQIHNGKIYQEKSAALVLSEADLRQNSALLSLSVLELLNNSRQRTLLGERMHDMLPKTPAAQTIAELLLGHQE